MPSDVPVVMSTRSGRHGDAAARIVRRHRFPRLQDADRGQIAVVAVPHGAGGGLDEMRRGLESEGDRIADVQIPDVLARCFHGLRFRHDVSDGVGEPVDPRGHRNRPGALCTHVPILRRSLAVTRAHDARLSRATSDQPLELCPETASGCIAKNYIPLPWIGCNCYTAVQLLTDRFVGAIAVSSLICKGRLNVASALKWRIVVMWRHCRAAWC